MEKVFLSPCANYDREEIANIVDQMAGASGSLQSLRGATVLLKPNLISGRGSALSCSHPEFIAGVALWLRAQGSTVKLGDSPAFGSAMSVCRARGIMTALKGLDVEVIEFATPVKRRIDSGRTITLAGEAFDCDYFIGLPRIKAHNQMYVTLAVKNLFGVVKGVNKAMLHMTSENSHEQFSQIIMSLVEMLPPQFHFIDGIEVMSVSGPLDGKALRINCIGASASPVALDTSLLDLLQLEPKRSPLYVAARKKGLQAADTSNLSYPFLQPSAFHGSGFLAPGLLNPIRFNPFRFISGMCKRIGIKLES